MTWNETAAGVFYSEEPLVAVAAAELSFLISQARANSKGRARLCAHGTVEDPVQEMLICLCEQGYVAPHRHQKAESLHAIEGGADLILFDESGGIERVLALGTAADQMSYVRLPPDTYHTLCVTTEYFVFHETSRGPFRPEDTQYAPWAPAETETQQARDYLHQLQDAVRQARLSR